MSNREIYKRSVGPYKDRVAFDGGNIDVDWKSLEFAQLNECYRDNLLLSVNSFGGQKLRTSGIYNYVSKSYDLAPHAQQYGPELVVNGGFDSDMWWEKGDASIVISGGVCNYINTPNNKDLRKTGIITLGKYYKVTFTISTISQGSLRIIVGGNMASDSYSTAKTSVGTYTEYLKSDGVMLYINTVGTTSATIDNFSVREVLTNELTQSTALSQPYSVKIAPNEVNSFVNPNGGASYLTHPAISFGANDKWTVEVCLNWNGSSAVNVPIFGTDSKGELRIKGTYNVFRFINDNPLGVSGVKSTSLYIGKTIVITAKANGDGNLLLYVNGIYSETITIATNLTITNLFQSQFFAGKIYTYSIWNTALPASEISRRASVIKSIIPEIENVRIGTQTWALKNCDMVTTPQGNAIQEVTDNSNVEKVTNQADRDFSSDTGFWMKTSGVTISGGVCNIVSTSGEYQSLTHLFPLLNYWYKITLSVDNFVSVGGNKLSIAFQGGETGILVNTNGTYTCYAKSLAFGTLEIKRLYGTTAMSCTIDNVSCQLVGWSDSQNMYNALIAQGYTVANATKACAWWSHYNNDPANGAIYGKLYNWYAVKTFQDDIDAYNVINPTNRWGWHVPSQAEFTTLQTYLGGASVAGGKMKMPGTAYWTTPNTGADNSSGFSALGTGRRTEDGAFSQMLSTWFSSIIQEVNPTNTTIQYIMSTQTDLLNGPVSKVRGYSLRLIKD